MLKILSQILIVLLAIGLVAGATYLIVTQTGSATAVNSDRPAFDGNTANFQFQGNHNGPGQGLGQGDGPHGAEGGSSSQAWMNLLKNLGLIAAATVLFALLKLVFSRKPKTQLVIE